jgi:hypothetical protein
VSLADDLAQQARMLATVDAGRPKQANLRRAVSAAYYALFHFLVDAAVRRLVRRADGEPHRDLLARAFQHSEMKQVARAITGRQLPQWWFAPPPTDELVTVARAFHDLQEARHGADHDRQRSFTRAEALAVIDRATEAMQTWAASVSETAEGDLFLIGLLARSRFDRH